MYEKIKKILSTREHIYLVNEDYKRVMITRFLDKLNEKIGYFILEPNDMEIVGEDELNKYIKNHNWQIIDVFDTPREQFNVWDEVVVTGGKYKGKKGEVLDFEGEDYTIILDGIKSNDNSIKVKHNQLSYPFQEEKELKSPGCIYLISDLFNVDTDEVALNGKRYKLTEIK